MAVIKRKFTVIAKDGKLWARNEPPCGSPDDVPISDVLRWVLEQINFEQMGYTLDDDGCLESMTLGLPEARDAEEWTVDDVAERVRLRLRAVNLCGVYARAREEGISPDSHAFAEESRLTDTEAAYDNTEIHYAFELLDILGSIRRSTYVFNSPPIVGVAAPEVVALLREATRAYLFGQLRSCVTLCRALIEAALESRTGRHEIKEERERTRLDKGTLECLIDIAGRRGILPAAQAAQAHEIRKLGNRVLHRRTEPPSEEVWAVLLDTRAIVEAVYARPA